LQDFTADPAMIVAALRGQHGQTTGKDLPGSTGNPVLDQTPCATSSAGCGNHTADDQGSKELQIWTSMLNVQESFEAFRDRNARLDTLNSMQQLAQWLSGIPGRKTLIWAGSGVQLYGGSGRNYAKIDFRSVGQAMDENTNTFNQLSAANVAVYPL